MKYYRYNPGYLKGRVHEVRNYPLRVVICLVDIEDSAKIMMTVRTVVLIVRHPLADVSPQLSQECLLLNVTLILAWSHKEAARCGEVHTKKI